MTAKFEGIIIPNINFNLELNKHKCDYNDKFDRKVTELTVNKSFNEDKDSHNVTGMTLYGDNNIDELSQFNRFDKIKEFGIEAKDGIEIKVGSTLRLQPYIIDNQNNKITDRGLSNIGDDCIWTTSAPAICEILNIDSSLTGGFIKGKAIGTSTITVQFGSLSKNIVISVIA